MRIHASKSGRSSRKAGFAVVWRGREEMPGRELKFADGTSRWYGSGCVVFDTSDGRITMRPVASCRRRRPLGAATRCPRGGCYGDS